LGFLDPGADHAGGITVADISLPGVLVKKKLPSTDHSPMRKNVAAAHAVSRDKVISAECW
jgi:hypothetical protein